MADSPLKILKEKADKVIDRLESVNKMEASEIQPLLQDPRNLEDFFKFPETIKNLKKEDIEIPLLGMDAQLELLYKCKKLFKTYSSNKGSLFDFIMSDKKNRENLYDVIATTTTLTPDEVKNNIPLYEMVGLLRSFFEQIKSLEVIKLLNLDTIA